MTLEEFQRQVFVAAISSPVCDIPLVRRLTPTSVNIRLDVKSGGFVEAFHNEQSGTTADALVRNGKRVLGADNTGGWHLHPCADPKRHDPLPGPMPFAEFVLLVERC